MSPLQTAGCLNEGTAETVTRRSVLGGALGLTLSSLVMGADGTAASDSSSRRRVVDTHHHFISPGFAAAKGDVFRAISKDNQSSLTWKPQRSIDVMDQAGVSQAIISLATPGVWFGNVEEGRRLAREVNEFAAASVAQFPGRFGFFAALPLPDTEGCLLEIKHSLDVLKADGLVLMTNYDGKYLGDSRFARVFAELNERKSVVYVHPRTLSCCSNFVPELPDPYLEFVFDSTRTITSLLFTGTLARTHGIRWLFSHGGGTLPMVAGRVSGYFDLHAELRDRMPQGPMAELRQLFYDTANVTHPEAFAGVRTMVKSSQILFGTDFPYLSIANQLKQLRESNLGAADLEAIEHGNADRLFPARSPTSQRS